MPWGSFKSAMASVMSNWTYGQNMDNWAIKLTSEYDKAVKSGKTNGTSIPMQVGKTADMQGLLQSELHSQQQSKTKTLLEICGPAVVAYWTGAMIMTTPPGPPCPGTISNVSVNSAPVTNPGTWTSIPDAPCNDVNIWLDRFIICAKKHMLTTEGQHNEISLYPGSPPPPLPCTQKWSGYTVPG